MRNHGRATVPLRELNAVKRLRQRADLVDLNKDGVCHSKFDSFLQEGSVCDEEIVTNENGGKGSKVHARYDLLPAEALKIGALRMGKGAVKYGEWNWLKCPASEHLAHLLNHINEYRLDPDHPEDHLAGIAARAYSEIRVRGGTTSVCAIISSVTRPAAASFPSCRYPYTT